MAVPTAREADDDRVALSISEAVELACKSLHDTGQPAIVREVIALRIVQLAAAGERDPERLSATALASLGVIRAD
jgi:hypothetical protein